MLNDSSIFAETMCHELPICKRTEEYPHNRAAARRRAVEAADEGVRAEWRPGAALAGTTALGDVGSRGGALGGDVDGGGARGARAVGGAGGTDGGREEGRRREEARKYMGGGLLSRVKPPPGTKGPFVPGGGFTRDKRGFWAGRENSQPTAHL